MERSTISTGLRVTFDDAGDGEPAVVLIHGWAFGNRSHMAGLLEHLAPTRRVILLDLPGQGGSDPVPAGFGLDDCAAAIAGVLDASGVERAVVCGHSLGGRLAVEVAAAHPRRVAGVALLDPVLLFPAPVRERAAMLAAAIESERWQAALEGYFSMLLSPFDAPGVRARVLAELAGVSRPLAAQVMRAGMATDGAGALERVRCPLLVIRRADQPLDVQRLRELQPDAWVGEVVGTGHWLTLSAADQVNAMLDRFIAFVDARSGEPAPSARP